MNRLNKTPVNYTCRLMQKKRSDTSSIADTPELIISQAKESVPVQGIQANWLLAFSDTAATSIGLIQSSCLPSDAKFIPSLSVYYAVVQTND